MIKATLTIYYNKGQHKTYKRKKAGLIHLIRTLLRLYYFKNYKAKLVIEKRQDE